MMKGSDWMKRKTYVFVLAGLLVLGLLTAGFFLPAGKPLLHIHRYAETLVAPTCETEGCTVFTCTCGASYEKHIVPALGHSYDSTVVPPTWTAEGYTQYICRVCLAEYKDSIVPPPSDVMSPMAAKDYLLPFQTFSRARTQDPEFVMLHFTSAVALNPKDPYNQDLVRGIFEDYEVSVHYIIDREGNVRCYIPEELVAYHAGYGTWANDPKYTDLLNEYAIGIEIMAIGSQKDMAQYMTAGEYSRLNRAYIGYTDAQYDTLKALVGDICDRHHIPMDREHIIGHEEYSPAKTDPGELFDWDRLLS